MDSDDHIQNLLSNVNSYRGEIENILGQFDVDDIQQKITQYKSKAKGPLEKSPWHTDGGVPRDYFDGELIEPVIVETVSHVPGVENNLTQHRQIIWDNLNAVLGDLEVELARVSEGKYEGCFKPIGSSACGTDCGQGADFDYLFEIKRCDLIIEQQKQDSCDCRLYVNNISPESLLCPHKEYKDFADCVHKSLENIKLRALNFGGFAHLQSSGVRHCEPAVTALFRWYNYNIPVDITLGYVIPCDDKSYIDTRNILAKFSQIKLCKIPPLTEDEVVLHFVPVCPETGYWCRSTAVLETTIQKHLPDFIKNEIKRCKKAKNWLEVIAVDTDEWVCGFRTFLRSIIDQYRKKRNCGSSDSCHNFGCKNNNCENSDCQSAKEICSIIRDILSGGHIFLDKGFSDYSESCTKCPVSVNSSAIKYKALNLFLSNPQHYIGEGNNCLARDILDGLLSESIVHHTFLQYKVSVITVASHSAYQKHQLHAKFRQHLKAYIQKKL